MPNAGDIIRASDVAVQACRVKRAAAQSIPDNTLTTVTFDTEQFDTDGMHSTSVNNSRITIQTAGFYTFGFVGEFVTGVAYTRVFAAISLNGATDIARSPNVVASGTIVAQLNVNAVYQFGVGDYIEVQVFQLSTAARNLVVTADRSPEFYAARIGS